MAYLQQPFIGKRLLAYPKNFFYNKKISGGEAFCLGLNA
jgi:hypothetical protein